MNKRRDNQTSAPDRELSPAAAETLRRPGSQFIENASEGGLVIILNGEIREMFQQFAAEEGIENPAEAIARLLYEYTRLNDLVWEEKLSRGVPVTLTALDTLLEQVDADIDAGLAEDLTPDLFDR